MPLFEYECRACATRFELLVRSDTTARCPSCQGEELEKLLSVFAINAQGAATQKPKEDCGSCSEARPGGCPYASA